VGDPERLRYWFTPINSKDVVWETGKVGVLRKGRCEDTCNKTNSKRKGPQYRSGSIKTLRNEETPSIA